MSLFGDGLELLKLVDKGRNSPLYLELGKWIDKVGELQKENATLNEENARFREQIRFRGLMERIRGHVFVEGDDEERCPRCAEADLKLIHLVPIHSKHAPYQKAACPSCKIGLLPISR